jgi:hypothetical protein
MGQHRHMADYGAVPRGLGQAHTGDMSLGRRHRHLGQAASSGASSTASSSAAASSGSMDQSGYSMNTSESADHMV